MQAYAALPSSLVSLDPRLAAGDGPDAVLLDALQRLGSGERAT